MEKVVAPPANIEAFRSVGAPTGQLAAPYPWMRVSCKLLRCRASKGLVGVGPRKLGQRLECCFMRRSRREARYR